MAKTPRKGDNFVTTHDQELPKGGVLIRVPKGTPGQVVTRHRDGSLYVIMAGWWWGMPGDAVEVTSQGWRTWLAEERPGVPLGHC